LIGQTKDQLEQERKKLIREIEETNKYLQKATKNKQITLKDIKAISAQVDFRKKLIKTISSEIIASDQKIKNNLNIIDSLNINLNNLNKQYAELQRYTYLRELSSNKWSYLLSSENMNTFFLRWRYIKQFEAFSENKKYEIVKLSNQIQSANQDIQKTKAEKGALLNQEKKETSVLEEEKMKKDKMLKDLTTKETILKADLQKQKKERERLNIAIESIIAEQLRLAREKNNASIKSNPNKEKELDTETEKLSGEFGKNKNKLPWPVSSGFISSKFGVQPHPTIKGVTIENNGIDISGNGAKDVKAVFDGEVVGVTKVPGYKHMVIIKHGTYYSVYSNLEDVYVRQGKKISTQESVGRISVDEDGNSELHFELWKDKVKLNPEGWLK
jgi:septal ring factor EnvC (AmiA/AmiB activator)